MNILEAYECLRQGKPIKLSNHGCIRYIIQANLFPFDEKTLYIINPSEDLDDYPSSLADVSRDVMHDVPVEALRMNNYKETTIEEILRELQKYYVDDRK